MKYNKSITKNTKSGVRYTFLLLVAGVLLATSCSDMQTDTQAGEPKQELTPEQVELRNKLKATALLMKQVVVQPDALRELRYAIDFYTKNRNADERVSFSALFDEEAAYKAPWRKAKAAGNTTTFAEVFKQVVSQKRKSTSSSSLDLEEFLLDEDVTVYFPYSENWEGEEITPTLTYHPIDNEHVNEGWEPVNSKGKTTGTGAATADVEGWNEVTVNDEYAQIEPTYIIAPCENCGGGGGSGGSSDNTYSINVDEDANTTTQVKLGYIKLTQQLDGLFKGGSDLRFLFVDVVEIQPGVIEAREVTIKKDLTRPDVSNQRWKYIYVIADHRWHSYQKTLPLYAYEHDGKAGEGTISITTTLKTSDGSSTTIETELPVSGKRDGIQNFYFDRAVFLTDNKNNGGWGLKEGYQIYKANSGLSFTLPHRIININ